MPMQRLPKITPDVDCSVPKVTVEISRVVSLRGASVRILFQAMAAAAAIASGSLAFAPARAADTAASFQLNAAHDGQIKFDRPFRALPKRKWTVDLGDGVSSPL